MGYKENDRVRIKSIDWYDENKDINGDIIFGEYRFVGMMSDFCGKILTIHVVFEDGTYLMTEDSNAFVFTDEMIEGLVEDENLIERVDDNGLPFNEWLSHKGAFHIPDGYELKDENGNVIPATKIILEKKKPMYPKTYEECCKVLDISTSMMPRAYGYNSHIIGKFQELLICRDAYWKIAGEEMGLGKPWEPDWKNSEEKRYSIVNIEGNINLPEKVLTKWVLKVTNKILVFPTEKIRDAFYDNFKELINECKELL